MAPRRGIGWECSGVRPSGFGLTPDVRSRFIKCWRRLSWLSNIRSVTIAGRFSRAHATPECRFSNAGCRRTVEIDCHDSCLTSYYCSGFFWPMTVTIFIFFSRSPSNFTGLSPGHRCSGSRRLIEPGCQTRHGSPMGCRLLSMECFTPLESRVEAAVINTGYAFFDARLPDVGRHLSRRREVITALTLRFFRAPSSGSLKEAGYFL